MATLSGDGFIPSRIDFALLVLDPAKWIVIKPLARVPEPAKPARGRDKCHWRRRKFQFPEISAFKTLIGK
jgi:hypothetical protein